MLEFGSLFAGIGGFDLGFERAGMTCAWQVEIDARCNEVLAHHWPDVPRLGDIRDCGDNNLLPVNVISFGSPCQDLSVAGKRGGLNGQRSGLFYEAIRIVAELKPAFALWENVPGALSSNSGRDFAAVLAAFQNIGARDIAWTCLDAQYFGVAQRRRRVFLVADFGGERAAKILFESESLRRDSVPRRKAGQGIAAPVKAGAPSRRNGGSWPIAEEFVITGTLNSGGNNGGFRTEPGEHVIVQHALSGHNQRNDSDGEHFVVPAVVTTSGALCFKDREGCAGGGKGLLTRKEQAFTISASQDQNVMTFDNSPNTCYNQGITQTGRLDASTQKIDAREVLSTLRQEIGAEAFTEWGLGILDSLRQAQILRPSLCGNGSAGKAEDHKSGLVSSAPKSAGVSGAGGVRTMWGDECARRTSQRRELAEQRTRELGAYLSQLSQPGTPQAQALYSLWQASEGIGILRQTLSEIQEMGQPPSGQAQSTQPACGVRRLTPTEAERLQGFPDGWTAVNGMKDTPRYRMLGNAVCVPVAEWIGRRLGVAAVQ